MTKLKMRQVSSLEKVFLHFQGGEHSERILACGGETVSYQIAYTAEVTDGYSRPNAQYCIKSPLAQHIRVYRVGNVPGELTAYPNEKDEHYITTEPGIFPDPLYPVENDNLDVVPGLWHALWIEVNVPAGCAAGEYPVTVEITWEDQTLAETMQVEVLGADLPPQKLLCTNWFHVDCIADLHNTEIFSETHWNLIQKYMEMAAEHGMNVILTPVLTPPLDTAVGTERPTVQLVEIEKKGSQYTFDFRRLERYVAIAQACGIKYFEINQVFTQWGAYAAPKVVASVDGEKDKRIFGWNTPAQSPEYKEFLGALLPAVVRFFEERGMGRQVIFHISDEPTAEHEESYRAAMEVVRPLVDGYPIIDALSDFGFWKKGLVEHPVVSTNHIAPFLENGCEALWCYYCCAQGVDVANRFLAMPSSRNRILGVQMYKYDIAGFLHWGYNFYYSALSRQRINPFTTTDAIGAFPAGDPFVVYPWHGEVIPSLRLKVFREALQDMRLLALAEQYAGREAVLSMLAETAGGPLTFTEYPREDAFIFHLRQKAFTMLSEYIH